MRFVIRDNIPMSQVFLYWSEIEDGDFPDCCITCGCEDSESRR